MPTVNDDDIPLLKGYRPLDGAADEMVDGTGALRPVWQHFMKEIGRLGPDEIAARARRADQYLNDAGVYYRFYDQAGSRERDWPLAHLPLLIGETEWRIIADGLCQRADLLEQIVADIYGPNRLVEQRLLPPELIAANPEYLRPVAGHIPLGGNFLHFCAFELGRGPDGRWWVLSDRTQAPSGIGFALENRVATTKAFSDIYNRLHVHRLAGFHRRFRDALTRLAGSQDLTAILTPGPFNETYYEQAYIARYLGISLLEGEDLIVTDGQVKVRTVSGLQPVNVLWRRLDAGFADPLELDQDSQIGTPGLVEAVRNRSVHVVNALGSGVLEMRALLAFLPRIARALSGQPLKLPSIATWWCGQDAERDHVLAHFDKMMIGPALSARMPFEDPDNTVLGGRLAAPDKAAWHHKLKSDGPGFVGQESVRLSTAPVFTNGRLEPRPVTLRVFLARTPDGWAVMHGGFARIGQTLDASAIAMQRGGRAADVWIVSDSPVEQETLLETGEAAFVRRLPGTLPSQAAENLTWLGRYTERLEGTTRTLRAWHVRLAEREDPDAPLLALVRDHLAALEVDIADPVPGRLADYIDRAVITAGNVRSRFSPDGWLALRDLSKTIHQLSATVEAGDDATRAMTVVLRKLAGFSGLVHENMYRFTGWRFLEIGRRLERAIHMTRTLALFTQEDMPVGAWDMLLEIADSTMTHRRQYESQLNRLTLIDLLALDPNNPRSVMFQLDTLRTEIAALPVPANTDRHQRLQRHVLKLHTDLQILEPGDVTGAFLATLQDGLEALYDSLAQTYY
ncbi:circularly permuted type 2 ATP-grasp protein [Aquisalinus flavus]|uniref:DUF403 domain-containing protein n=1 Tax=Aquisalinus flavus TaxID=1526572 RepID=A0A8J2V548_9PROT|nr:circularly permuted type 2 ATP-grasp protein [Aquisalinus flavus]MBD0426461.1 circularly permuted type 2 ATP-grasp protein [Aquisalinus flavus]UNE47985.1 hypothetical protein FF099_07955 [Aquisalinus flavus]GGD07728.1 hypothetical protein GCM10011342_15750 [Aquisalinus flavus]